MTTLSRGAGAEKMDERGVEPAQLARSLADLRAVNRWLGGTRVIIRHLDPMLRRLSASPVRILDVATGSADIPLHLVDRARSHGIRLRIVATDLHPRTLDVARERTASTPEIQIEPADALDLPYADDSFDVALCSTALHHFNRNDAVRVLRELDRVARFGVVVNDLRRSRPALLGARFLAATVWRNNPVTRHDGPLSVRRAFTAAELRSLAREAGMHRARVLQEPIFRLALVVDHTTPDPRAKE